jgi:hypothetical protein
MQKDMARRAENKKKKEAARRANACATGGYPAPVCNLRRKKFFHLK